MSFFQGIALVKRRITNPSKLGNYTTNVKEISNLTKGITLTGYDQEQRYWEINIPKDQ